MLDVSQSRAVNADVQAACAQLPHLEALLTDQCHKLTSDLSDALCTPAHARQLRKFSAQRCYQLTSVSLWQLLQPTASSPAGLQALAVSHVECFDMSELAAGCLFADGTAQQLSGGKANKEQVELSGSLADDGAAGALDRISSASRTSSAMSADTAIQLQPPAPSASSRLRVLALHSCTRLSLSALTVILTATPAVEMLLLGGAVLHAPEAGSGTEWQAQHMTDILAAVTAEHEAVRSSVKANVAEQQADAAVSDSSKRCRCGACLLCVGRYVLPVRVCCRTSGRTHLVFGSGAECI